MISIFFSQWRGKQMHGAKLSSPVVPRKGETVCVDGREIVGIVDTVQYVYVSKPDAPRVLDHVNVTLEGWKANFGKD